MSITPRTIRLVAPSGYCQNQSAAARGIARLQALGHRVENSGIITRRDRRFAGNDNQRLQDINELAHLDTLPDIVLAVRGGYGASRLLANIDYPALRQRLHAAPLAICGHSDFTAIQLALLAQSGVQSFSAPMLTGNFGAEVVSEFTVSHFWQALTTPEMTLRWTTLPQQLQVSGTVWGGNLAMIAAMIGTAWMPDIQQGILVIEDVNEPPFRIERMLLQLHHSGILARQRAIVTGSFSGTTSPTYDSGYDFNSVWNLIRDLTGLPVVNGLPFGHDADTVTLPVGAQGLLKVDETSATLRLSGYPVLRQLPGDRA
ncbi:muramoyltetrapeptide carboxypeptidase [Erwinia pyrifoliae]|uniref:Muramoyltetrapeptide carboxypeptidase n=1 Tax=Erwinia pyrifoliae TaxID=79967 RepID=A0ABY5X4E4_ERWPY|nr:muramoyltetrapeptide carboxypeptidase [Erwinia pyrifoliae]AUX72509.1 muramoyltetrapeptide carboxypeptidase [Erwinia pyrifoliae]MCA8877239.1 muramoyltetrapeptide carboxypeptidase [Erwinia pyrifoliae]MCT2387422.1 muramoyltetrapeptide carboxypeptidase [Erwinia pyrifoliae]MCU8586978.1 muramoyltetrapeptide carboxypeptidase [Erwinia pyrifoliae]UWS31924.1 muramoyltetrapeptide carboxypeptidase [Erwinia pyrifoliae]